MYDITEEWTGEAMRDITGNKDLIQASSSGQE